MKHMLESISEPYLGGHGHPEMSAEERAGVDRSAMAFLKGAGNAIQRLRRAVKREPAGAVLSHRTPIRAFTTAAPPCYTEGAALESLPHPGLPGSKLAHLDGIADCLFSDLQDVSSQVKAMQAARAVELLDLRLPPARGEAAGGVPGGGGDSSFTARAVQAVGALTSGDADHVLSTVKGAMSGLQHALRGVRGQDEGAAGVGGAAAGGEPQRGQSRGQGTTQLQARPEAKQDQHESEAILRRMQEVSELVGRFTDQVSAQASTILSVQATAEESNAALTQGTKQLDEALEGEGTFRWAVFWLLVAAGLLLLALDYFA